MNCASVQAVLDLFKDDRLTPARRKEVERHLDSCPRCAGEARPLPAAAPVKAPAALLKALGTLGTGTNVGGTKGPVPIVARPDWKAALAGVALLVVGLALLHATSAAPVSERPVAGVAAPWRLP